MKTLLAINLVLLVCNSLICWLNLWNTRDLRTLFEDYLRATDDELTAPSYADLLREIADDGHSDLAASIAGRLRTLAELLERIHARDDRDDRRGGAWRVGVRHGHGRPRRHPRRTRTTTHHGEPMTAPQPEPLSPAWWNAQALAAPDGKLRRGDIEKLAGVSLTDPDGGAWFANMGTKLPSLFEAEVAGALYFAADDMGQYFASGVGFVAPGTTNPWEPDLSTKAPAPLPASESPPAPPPEPPPPYHVKGHTPHRKGGAT